MTQTHTLDAGGRVLTVEQEGVSMPADYSFQCVNDYVHDTGRHFEELQCLALGMACEAERLREAVKFASVVMRTVADSPALSDAERRSLLSEVRRCDAAMAAKEERWTTS